MLNPLPLWRGAARAGLALCAGLAGLAANPAAAQSAGTYTGLNAQGYTMQVVVQPAPSGGNEVTEISAGYLLTCAETGTPIWLSSVVSGFFPVDAGGGFDATWLWAKDHFRTAGQFSPNGTVQGQTDWSIPGVAAAAPHAAELCSSGPQAWSANRTGLARTPAPATRAGLPHWQLLRRFDRQGRVTLDRLERLQ